MQSNTEQTQQNQADQIHSKIYKELSQPNPVQKRCLQAPFSIFPFISLPEFNYSQLSIQLASNFRIKVNDSPDKCVPRIRSLSPNKKNKIQQNVLNIETKQLQDLFWNPLYVSNERFCRNKNKNFACLKAYYQQSSLHPTIYNSEYTFQQSNLAFQSRFQTGNLAFATQSIQNQSVYYLLVHKDFNTSRCTQWFFFKVFNKNKSIHRFHILNFFKSYSAFQSGMKICFCSKSNNYKWTRGGQDIQYRKTNIKSGLKNLYALSFSFDFKQKNDQTFFAYNFPYTFSMMDRFLLKIQNQFPDIVKRKTLGYSLGKNYIDMITITNSQSKNESKKIIVFTSRVHPGQTPSSFVAEGLIKFLLGNNIEAETLRQQFIFKFVPMLNPDGVINGNYRCSLSGYDLNRVWDSNDKQKFPQIYYTKRSITEGKKPFIFIDLHAHSKKKGFFMYGCQKKQNPFISRQLPFLFWKNISEFVYHQCNFSVNQERKGTARLSIYKQLAVDYCYTLECSFLSALKSRFHFNAEDYINLGQNILLIFYKFYCRKKQNQIADEEQLFKELYTSKDLIKIGNNQCNSSSDSQIQEVLQIQPVVIQISKKTKNQQKNNLINLIRTQSRNNAREKKNIQNQFNFTQRRCSMKEKSQSLIQISPKKQKNTTRQIPIIGLNLCQFKKHYQNHHNFQEKKESHIKLGYTSFSSTKEAKQKQSGFFEKLTPRYADQDANQLTNLFLPSVTSSSYKRYAKNKNPNKEAVLVGRKYLQSARILKQQIKPNTRKK